MGFTKFYPQWKPSRTGSSEFSSWQITNRSLPTALGDIDSSSIGFPSRRVPSIMPAVLLHQLCADPATPIGRHRRPKLLPLGELLDGETRLEDRVGFLCSVVLTYPLRSGWTIKCGKAKPLNVKHYWKVDIRVSIIALSLRRILPQG